MLKKPETCRGCALYGDGQGFVGDNVKDGAPVLILAQNPGEYEERGQRVTGYIGSHPQTEQCTPQPLIGPTGYMLNKTFLPLAGLAREDVSTANVLRCRYHNSNDMPPTKVLREAVQHCSQYNKLPAGVQLIVAMGAHAWSSVGGLGSITEWRGSLTQGFWGQDDKSVYATVHLADLFRDSRMDVVTRGDYAKIRRILKGEWPLPLPEVVTPVGNLDSWMKAAISLPFVAIDTEYDPTTRHLILAGVGGTGIPTLQIDMRDPFHRVLAKGLMTRVMRANAIVYHNALADVPILEHNLGLSWKHHNKFEDTMQAHAVLWSELPHTLEFCASVYGGYNAYKHMSKDDLLLYHRYDVSSTVQVWEALSRELSRDADSKKVYETQMHLLPHIHDSMKRGISVNAEKVQSALVEYNKRLEDAEELGQAAVGYPINLRSDNQIKLEVYDVAGLAVQKHPKTKQPSVAKDAVAVLRGKFLEVDPDEEISEGYILQRIEEGADPLLEATVLAGEAQQAVSHFLSPLVKEDGSVVKRVYPNISLHAQANARWSITDPPVGLAPKPLVSMYQPDPGWPWLIFDMDQIELRLVAMECQDPKLLEAFEKGWDIHSLSAYAMFNLPLPPDPCDPSHGPLNEEWRKQVKWLPCDHAHEICGKDDPRRHFAKTFTHRASYGGTARKAGDIPGAKKLGLKAKDLTEIANRRAAMFPRLIQWQNETAERGAREGVTRTWYGRRRCYLGRRGAYIKGQMLDHPMQAGVADMMMLIFLEIKEAFGPAVYYVYGKHDSQIWGVQQGAWEEIVPQVKSIVTKPREINGRVAIFPASFKERWP